MAKYKITKQEKEELEKILRQLVMFCQMKRIPLFVSAAVENKDEETIYINHVLSPGANGLPLTDDRIRQYILIANGSHEAVSKREHMEINMEELPWFLTDTEFSGEIEEMP